MATQTIYYPTLEGLTGRSLRLRSRTNASVVDTQNASETAANSGIQSAAFTDIPAGTYTIQLLNGTDVEGDDVVTLTLTTGVFWPGASSSSGGGDASQTTLLAVKAKTDLIGTAQGITSLEAAAVLDAGTISGFPTELVIGDSYDDNSGEIEVTIVDDEGDPITSMGSLDFDDAEIEFVAFRTGDPSSLHIVGTCTYAASIVTITLPSSQTSLAKAEFTYEGRLKFIWEADDAQKTFKTTQFKFVENP